jgi:hypothetical protein
MATENGFDHQRNGNQKNLGFRIVTIENQDCDDQRFSGVVNFYFFDDQIFGCLIQVIESTMHQLPLLIWQPNFLVAIFCN